MIAIDCKGKGSLEWPKQGGMMCEELPKRIGVNQHNLLSVDSLLLIKTYLFLSWNFTFNVLMVSPISVT